jgi:hypothetical protein
MKRLTETQRVAVIAYVALVLCSVTLVAMHYVYYICREYQRWYCYAPWNFPYLPLGCLLVSTFFLWRLSRILAAVGLLVCIFGLVVVSLPVL